MKPLISFCCVFLFIQAAFAQLGGRQSFSFLNLPANARIAGLGSINVSASTEDAAMFLANPALWSKNTHKQLSINYFTLNSGINGTTLAFANALRQDKMQWGVGVQYLHYGTFKGYDDVGNTTTDFTASDFALTLSVSHRIAPFQLGANLKLATSSIAQWGSSAVLLDIGGAFVHPTQDFRVGLVIRNVGFAMSNYLPANSLVLPFDVQIGATYKPEKMPLRFSFTAHQLFPNGEIAYNDLNQNNAIDLNGNRINAAPSAFDKIARRVVIGAELVPSTKFNVRVGYNFLQRRELSIESRRALSGFSFGAMLKLKSLRFEYARNIRHVAGALNCLALQVDMNTILKKKTVN